MECAYWRADVCHSCTWIERPLPDQVRAKELTARALVGDALGARASALVWDPPATSPERDFRQKSKMVVGGTREAPTLGILGLDRRGVDLRGCPITDPAIREALPGIARVITECGLDPYDVPTRRGELKYVLVTAASTGELMVRFVLRSRRHLRTLGRAVPRLQSLVPAVRVVTANIHPTHEAIIEGPEEVVLTEADTLAMAVGDVVVDLGPRSFSQTNTAVAGALYRQVASWAAEGGPASLWDLYCGIGGFALHAARAGIPEVTGVEVSDAAVAAATRAASRLGPGSGRVRFVAADATRWAGERGDEGGAPEVVVVNPPRRGIGSDLAAWLDASSVGRLVYSSCNPQSLARDLAALPHLRPRRARLFDMFPHTPHAEVAVLLERTA